MRSAAVKVLHTICGPAIFAFDVDKVKSNPIQSSRIRDIQNWVPVSNRMCRRLTGFGVITLNARFSRAPKIPKIQIVAFFLLCISWNGRFLFYVIFAFASHLQYTIVSKEQSCKWHYPSQVNAIWQQRTNEEKKTHANINSLVVTVAVARRRLRRLRRRRCNADPVSTLFRNAQRHYMSIYAVFDSDFSCQNEKHRTKKCTLRRRWIEQKREMSPKRQQHNGRERVHFHTHTHIQAIVHHAISLWLCFSPVFLFLSTCFFYNVLKINFMPFFRAGAGVCVCGLSDSVAELHCNSVTVNVR